MSTEYVPIKEEDFWGVYKPQINHLERAKYGPEVPDNSVAPWGGSMYETFGLEVEYIQSLIKEGKRKNIWTIVDADGELIVQTGYWFVNRIGYIVTEQPWEIEGVHVETDEDEEIDEDDED